MITTLLAASLLASVPVAIDKTIRQYNDACNSCVTDDNGVSSCTALLCTEQTYADEQAIMVLAHRVLELEAQVKALTGERGHRTEWVIEAIAGKGFDWLTTGVGIHRGAVEANRLQPTAEIRLGSGAIAIALQYGLVELINKLFGDKAAVWVSRTITVGYAGLGFHNLKVANDAARGR